MPELNHDVGPVTMARVELDHYRQLAGHLSALVYSERETRPWWEARFAAKALLEKAPKAVCPPDDRADMLLRRYRQLSITGARYLVDCVRREQLRLEVEHMHELEVRLAPPGSLYYRGRDVRGDR